MNESLILNIGCGTKQFEYGNVNCDLFRKDIGHRLDGSIIEHAPNFVLCDALHLPFKSGVFYRVYSSQVIEHTKNPTLFMQECLRVCREHCFVTIRCPHWLQNVFFPNIFHISKLNRKWFKQFGLVQSYVYKYIFQFQGLIGFLPSEFEVVIKNSSC